MKIKSIAAICKKNKNIAIFERYSDDGDILTQYIGDGSAVYPIVLLIPARTDTAYFHDYIYGKAEIRFVRGRLRFTDDNGNAADPAPFPSMVVIYNGERVKE